MRHLPVREIAANSVGYVTLPLVAAEGQDANAFRILQDGGHEFLLDFVNYTEGEDTADVVTRVRVHREVLRSVQNRLAASILEPKNTAVFSAFLEGMT